MSGAVTRTVRRHLRALQTRFPGLIERKAAFQRKIRQLRKTPFEPEFELLQWVRGDRDQPILDIGGNRGQSIDAIRLFAKTTPIETFEANTDLSARLVAQYRNDPNTHINRLGLGDQASTLKLYIPRYRGFTYDGLASVDRHSAATWLNGNRLAGFDEKHLEIIEQTCEIAVLDTFDLDPFMVKIDVQGFEEQVLIGGERTLSRSEPFLLIEVEKDVPEILNDLGYREYSYTNKFFRAIKTRADRRANSLFLKPRHYDRFLAAGLQFGMEAA